MLGFLHIENILQKYYNKLMVRKNFLQERERGFTIIEVVLVLAVAGLIFLMIFLALPALQRSQRDTQRKSDIANLKAAITQYRTNNKGQLPAWTGNRSNYIYNASDSNTDLGFLNNYWRPTMYDNIEIMPTNHGWATSVAVSGGVRGMVIHMGGKCKQLDDGTWTTESDTKTPNRAAIYVILESIAPAKNYYGDIGANYCEDV